MPLWLINVLDLLLTPQLSLRDAPVGGERQLRRPQLAHFIAAIDPHEIIPWREIGQLEAQRRRVFTLRQRFYALVRYPQQQRQTEMAAGESDHIFLRVDGEILHFFGEIPQADHVRLPCQDFLFHIHENTGERLAGEAATPEADIVIAAENIQHRRAVIHGVAFHRQGLLLRPIAAQDKEQIAAIVLVEVIPGAVLHGQVIGRDHDDRVFEIG